ncbi:MULTISPECIES: DUF2182 domain-containing protein [unclassified Mesorhizobium]|uniref:copper chaperone n=1 Tax=unclassified Mesorhizobium TaxID=325217 RepID=UPI0003CF4D1A|nr:MULTISPECIES: DUF2182 domain-containing protein [unclassified Mesorhizobium]ESX30067.1 hypothetical protein X763_29555 [Mesorhizobium sp. LSHC432A00]ESX31232.1 hypothetical protein X764_30550 [Mesorhizobium sp. LSHC440A00]WJI57228.1 DUF2182 domain-containing protein [Mesorhizobium sp. C432A]
MAEVTMHRLAAVLAVSAPSAQVLTWLAMILAMMPPLLATPLLHVWQRSFSRRRVRAVALFVLGYAIVWLAAGIFLVSGSLVLENVASVVGVPPIAAASLLALLWQVVPLKQLSLNRCHRQPPLAAYGFRAETDAARYGASYSVWCVIECWALMLLPLAADHPLHWFIMVAVTLMTIVERAGVPRAPRWGAAWPGFAQPATSALNRISA